MKVSIAAATYNGADFLRQQLSSFSFQTRLPDELVITDDGSTDDTPEIVEQFARTAPFQVVLHRNDSNLGVTKNFEKAMSCATGEIIFLSDQDDIWCKDKVANVLTMFRAHPAMQVVINDARIVDSDAKPTGLTKLGQMRSLGFSEDHFVNGCCTAVRADFLKVLRPFPAEVAHDMWIHKLAVRLGLRMVCDEVLQDFRRHGSNASQGLSSQTRKVNKLDRATSNLRKDTASWCELNLQRLDLIRSRLQQHKDELLARFVDADAFNQAMQAIDRERSAMHARWQVVQSPRLLRPLPALKMLLRGDYKAVSGWQSFVKDLVLH